MQIGVDSMMLGAWTETQKINKILDVGTGCGLLTFMCAQRNQECEIHGIDISKEAIEEAEENRLNSPWPEQISFWHKNLKSFEPPVKYDLIISNPPFFNKQSLQSVDEARAKARHSSELCLVDIFNFASQNLSEDGKFSMVLPYQEFDAVQQLAFQYKFKIQRLSTVKPKEHKPPHRILLQLGREAKDLDVTEITIRRLDGSYTDSYKKLTHEYYLDAKVV